VRKLAKPLARQGTRHAGAAAVLAAAVMLLDLGVGPTGAAYADSPARAQLPDPTPTSVVGTTTPLDPAETIPLRVYLSGQEGRAAAAMAVSDPRSPAYAHFLSPAAFLRHFGPTATQTSAVGQWLTSQGMTITATTAHFIAVNATVAQVDAAFDTQVSEYSHDVTVIFRGHPTTVTVSAAGTVGGFSVPASLAADVTAVTGIEDAALPDGDTSAEGTATSDAPETQPRPATDAYQCSQYWGEHSEAIPAAYGHTTAPTQLCGYTAQQLRSAYGVASSRFTGKGYTIAILSDGYWPSMLSDANQYFANQGVPGFAPGQFSDDVDAAVAADDHCAFSLEEAIDVESAHIAAPDAKVVNVAGDCAGDEVLADDPIHLQYQLDAADRVVDEHLADVATGSYSYVEPRMSAADAAAWDLTLQQGALEGIGFDFSSGDGGPDVVEPVQPTAMVGFPAADPWATGVGGTSIAIGKDGKAVGDYAWGDVGTEVDATGTGYTSALPGEFTEGSGGGVSTLYQEPAYQRFAVPTSLATSGGTTSAHRVVPDISADAGSEFLIGYTGAVTPDVFSVVDEGGGTSAASPLIAGLEADAMQAAGHPLGFVNPALYELHKSHAIRDIGPVDPADPPAVIGAQPGLGEATDYLTTLGEDEAPLQEAVGYDDVTGLGAPSLSFVTSFRR
jgi:subtilase family serine protease